MQMQVQTEPAYVLHSRPYRDTSLLVELMSLHFGRVCLLAKGARSGRSAQQLVLQPFRPLLVSWAGRGEIPVLTRAEESGPGVQLARKDLIYGLYVNELLLRFLQRNDAHENLFKLYAQVLDTLQTAAGIESTLRIFERRLLEELGYGLVLGHDVESNMPVEADIMYSYVLDSGPVRLHDGCRSGIPVHGKSLIAFAMDELQDKSVMYEIKILMRNLIQHYLGGMPIRSREVLQSQLYL